MRRVAGIVLALLLSGGAARADCDHFKWSLAREKAWFASAPEPAGPEIAPGEKAYELALKQGDAAGFALPLKKPMAAGEYGGVVRIASVPKAGLYQVTLSREAWVDVIQNQARARTRNVSRQRDCPSFAKSVRFELAAGPAVLQISGVAAPKLGFAFTAAP
jgi:hypothetical protein